MNAQSPAIDSAGSLGKHPSCFVCGLDNPGGLRLSFTIDDDSRDVVAECVIGDEFQGFDGIVHGGIVTSILDDAMANRLFAKGLKCLTRDLSVRFMRPTRTGVRCRIRAWIMGERPPLYELKSELRQDGALMAKATGRFADPMMIQEIMNPKNEEDMT